ncbi:MAG: hypothetical protein QOD41_713, partial [Cryptosporangiaceae bacterium]|nr:hypothetical protein [Cryptosporangiaceae bacterium]
LLLLAMVLVVVANFGWAGTAGDRRHSNLPLLDPGAG